MTCRSYHLAFAALMLIGAGFAGSALAADAGQSTRHGTGQTIYLDPDTGNVRTPPGQTAHRPAEKKAPPADNKAWITPDGVQMLATDPANAPSETVVRCPDGSLRMGHAGHTEKTGSPDPGRAPLCHTPAHSKPRN